MCSTLRLLQSGHFYVNKRTCKYLFNQSFISLKIISRYFLVLLLANSNSTAQTVSSLWDEYKSKPYNHPNIPNNSYAGYGTGITPIPTLPSITPIDVTALPYDAIPDDSFDDQPAIQAAIDAAGAA